VKKTRYLPQSGPQISAEAILQSLQPSAQERAVQEYARGGIEAFKSGAANDPYVGRITALERNLAELNQRLAAAGI
jgi:hypothetical protein